MLFQELERRHVAFIAVLHVLVEQAGFQPASGCRLDGFKGVAGLDDCERPMHIRIVGFFGSKLPESLCCQSSDVRVADLVDMARVKQHQHARPP